MECCCHHLPSRCEPPPSRPLCKIQQALLQQVNSSWLFCLTAPEKRSHKDPEAFAKEAGQEKVLRQHLWMCGAGPLVVLNIPVFRCWKSQPHCPPGSRVCLCLPQVQGRLAGKMPQEERSKFTVKISVSVSLSQVLTTHSADPSKSHFPKQQTHFS